MFWNQQKIIFLIDGNVFWGILKHKIPAYQESTNTNEYKDTYLKKEICKEFVSKISFKRLANISCAFDIACDSEDNFIALVDSTKKYLNVPEYEPDPYDFSALLEDACTFDNSCDVVFILNEVEYPAHKFIICTRSEYFFKILQHEKSKRVQLKIDGLTNPMFECILKYIYSNEIGNIQVLVENSKNLKKRFF
jgi:hypothetical protein